MKLKELIEVLSVYESQLSDDAVVKVYDPYTGIDRQIREFSISSFGNLYINLEN